MMRNIELCTRARRRRKGDLNNTGGLGVCVPVNGVFIDVAIRNTHLSVLRCIILLRCDSCMGLTVSCYARPWQLLSLGDDGSMRYRMIVPIDYRQCSTILVGHFKLTHIEDDDIQPVVGEYPNAHDKAINCY